MFLSRRLLYSPRRSEQWYTDELFLRKICVFVIVYIEVDGSIFAYVIKFQLKCIKLPKSPLWRVKNLEVDHGIEGNSKVNIDSDSNISDDYSQRW